MAEPFTEYLRLLPPVFLTWMAWVVARTPYQARANRILAAFLGLVGLGFLLEFLWSFFHGFSPAIGDFFRGVQLLAGLLDPPLLLAYTLTFPRTRRAFASTALKTFYAAAIVGLFVAGIVFLEIATQSVNSAAYVAYAIAQIVYVNGTYIAAYVLLLGSYAREDRRYLSRQLFFLVLGVGFAALSRSAALFVSFKAPWAGPQTWWNPSLYSLGAALVVLGGIHVLRPRTHGDATRFRRVQGTLALLLGAFFLLWGLSLGLSRALGIPGILFSYFYSYRWIFFSLIVGFGILRYQLFDFELRTRQALALLLTVLVSLVSAIQIAMAATDRGLGTMGARLVGLLAGAALALPVYVLTRRAMNFLRPEETTPARYHERRLSLYEATLEFALQNPTWTEEERRFVETLRELFEISPEEHERVLERLRKPPAPVKGPSAS